MIGRRLDRLSQTSRQILNVAAVIGQEFSLGPLGQVVFNLSEDQLLEGLEEAIVERVIEEMPQTTDSYRFADARSQETLSRELSPAAGWSCTPTSAKPWSSGTVPLPRPTPPSWPTILPRRRQLAAARS